MCTKCYYYTYCSKQCNSQCFCLQENKFADEGNCGLYKIGNTCWMNTGLQCLLKTKYLTTYFKKGKYLSELNPKNNHGSHNCNLTKSFINLWKSM